MAEQESGLQFKKNRLKTFTEKGWKPSYNVKPEELATSGFIYEGNEDEVKCVCCQGKLKDWDHGDDPLEEHKNLSARCRFVVDPASCEGDPEAVCVSKAKPADDVRIYSPATEINCENCKSHKREIMFQPCQHLMYCSSCAENMHECPTCHSRIAKQMKVGLPYN